EAEDSSVDEEEDEGAIFPSSYLASLTKELSAAITDWDTVTPTRQEAIKSYIEGVSKPGLIIDGQHRGVGAKNVSEHHVQLPVIPENVTDKVVRAFMKMPRSRYKQLIAPLGEMWSDAERRLQIFFWFWNAIKDVYSDVWAEAETAADKGEKRQLFMKVSLLTL